MQDQETLLKVLDATERRRAERRQFLRSAGAATVTAGGLLLLSACGDDDDNNNTGGAPTPTPTPTGTATPAPTPTPTGTPTPTISDADVLNFALNLEYLEAQFYAYATTGQGLPANMLTGTGTQGKVTGGAQVPFQDPIVRAYANEIAADEMAHVNFLRTVLASAAVSMPAINIAGDANGAFTAAAVAAGVIPQGQTFNPYASDENFLLGAFIFEDVGVTAYKGAAPLITNKTYLEASAGILAAEAYHAGLLRTTLYAKGINGNAALITNAGKISDARDSLDGTGDGKDDDQGIATEGTGATARSNIVPADTNGIAFSRTPANVLNIVYLTAKQATMGGFFPAGVNGTFKQSNANG